MVRKSGSTIGDSITAVQAGRVGFGPNAVSHDRIESYFRRYKATGAQDKIEVCDFGDGAGKKHCKMGWNWRLAEASDAKYGVKSAYLNCGIGSTASGPTMPRPGIAGGLYPERLDTVLATRPDLVVLAFGMNERGSDRTGPNTAELIKRFQAIGATVTVMGVPKVNGCMWKDGRCPPWEKTNAILERTAAEDHAAFVDPRLIDLGPAPRHWCSSNNYNHPGISELLIYGQALASAVE
ncbi:MAG: SGNH/GDSL hydrolase family protein [Victivallales bacterium]|nr:SGNH/GDSL hydrolase family protein [Victivallales bacterium]